MGAMAILTAAGWPYAPAAVVAVEVAVLNNFFWHERWTWRDRAHTSDTRSRFVRFHLSTAVTSIVGSVVFTTLLVEWAGRQCSWPTPWPWPSPQR
jgi:putative flippase GtrA